MAYSTADNIAKWFLAKNKSEEAAGADMISNLKLQKLLYYAQGCTLALFNKPLFDDEIYAWQHGPVVPTIYHKYKQFHANGIAYEGENTIEHLIPDIEKVLEDVYEEFGQFSAWKLRNMTHEETPWKAAEIGEEIPVEIIKKYFVENYIEQ